jgi:integrase
MRYTALTSARALGRSDGEPSVKRPARNAVLKVCSPAPSVKSASKAIARSSALAGKTHESHQRAVKHLTSAFGTRTLTDLSADVIEGYLRARVKARVRRKTRTGVIEKGVVKPSTVHQEFRVFRRMLNVAVRKKLLPSNPCWGVEFPVAVKSVFRPHYMSWSEQQRIEAEAPVYLRNAIRIIAETGLRVYRN